MADHISDFTKEDDQIVLDLVNHDNETNLSLEQVTLAASASDGVGHTTLTVNAVPGSGYSGSHQVEYDKINIQAFVDVMVPDGLVVQQGNAVNISDLLPDINTALGTNIAAPTIVDSELVWEGTPNELLVAELLFTASGSKVYYGSVSFLVDNNEIPLSSAITTTVLSGLNYPGSVLPPETEYLYTRYTVNFNTVPGNHVSGLHLSFVGDEAEPLAPMSWRYVGNTAGESAWVSTSDLQASWASSGGFLEVLAPAGYADDGEGYFEIRADEGYVGMGENSLRVNLAVTDVKYFQTNRQPVVSFSKPYLTEVATYLPRAAINIDSMFENATAFNPRSVKSWDTSYVTSMSGLFYNASSFDQDISGWNVSAVENMEDIFGQCLMFNADLSGWNVANVTNYSGFDTNTPSWVLGKPAFTVV